MILGGVPGLALDRTGIALLAILILIVFGHLTSSDLVAAIDWTTIAMLFGLMVLSAQLYFGGFYAWIMNKLKSRDVHPKVFLFLIIFISGILSALLLNDIICLALTPLIINICYSKNWNPKPPLLGLMLAANVGSAMTIIGNPQNILISESVNLSFLGYCYYAAIPSFLGLFVIWMILCYQTNNNWILESSTQVKMNFPTYQNWQILKGILVLLALLVFFFFSSIPRYQLVLSAAGLLLLSREMTSKKILGFIDWQILILFFGLFLTNAAFLNTEAANNMINWIQSHKFDFSNPIQLFFVSAVLTNFVSNVPAVMLLNPLISTPSQGIILAISSTLAGNFFIIGSVSNLIVLSKAKDSGCKISWKDHLKAGVPITLSTIFLTIIWLYFIW